MTTLADDTLELRIATDPPLPIDGPDHLFTIHLRGAAEELGIHQVQRYRWTL